MYVCICMYVFMYVCMYICMHVCMYVWMHVLMMFNIDNMKKYNYINISVCDMIGYKIIYYRYKLSLIHFIEVIYSKTIFTL